MIDLIRLQGLADFDRALAQADKDLHRILRDDLREVAGVVAEEARHIAEEKGLVRSGDMVRAIQPFAVTGRAGVRSTAVHRGFRYPRRLEFEGRLGGEYGPEASLLPAAEAKQALLFERSEQLLDRLANDLAT